jgi:hypothetical protein
MNIPLDNISEIIREEILPELLSDLGKIAKACAGLEKGGKIALEIPVKVKGGRLVICGIVKSKKPLSARRDEAEKSPPVELASVDLAEDEGQDRIPLDDSKT